MSGELESSRAKRYRYYAKPHKTQFDGSEVKHVKGDLSASIDGNYTFKADKFLFQNPVVFQSTASLDGNFSLGGNLTIVGNLAVTGSVIITSSVLHRGDNIFGDEAADLHKFIGTTTASGDLNVRSNASLDGTLSVGGKATMRGITRLRATASLDAGLNVDGAAVLRSTASIDGTLSVGGDTTMLGQLDMSGQKIVSPKNVLRTEKLTVAAPFTQTASQLFTIFRASPGDTIFNAVGKAITNLGQTATPTIVRVSVGDAGDVDGFLTAQNATPMGWRWTAETNAYKGAYFYNASRDRVAKTYATATLIKVKVLASTMYLASLDVGEIEFYIDVMSRI